MEDYSNIRILLNIVCRDRSYYYSDIDGEAHSFTTSSNGKIIVEEDIVLYNGVILNGGDIKKEFNIESINSSIGNVSITIFNKDRLELGNKPVALESGIATLLLIKDNSYDNIIGSMFGKIDDISFDESIFKFSIRSESIVMFYKIPTEIFNESTFQTSLVLQDAGIVPTEQLNMRIPVSFLRPEEELVSYYVKKIKHPALAGKQNDYWKGARIDVVDAFGTLADPENENFAIGEFAVVIQSENDEIILPSLLDRYILYTFCDLGLRDSGNNPWAARGQLTGVAAALLNDGDYFVLNDGRNDAAYFYFDVTGTYTPPSGPPTLVYQIIITGMTAVQVASAIRIAINSAGLNFIAGTANEIINITNTEEGGIGNIPILEFVTTSLNPVGMSGGGPTSNYQMYDVINNTMKNTAKGSSVKITNGTFDDNSAWELGSGWSISSGKASKAPGVASNLRYIGDNASVIFVEGYKYEISFDLNIAAGSIRVVLRGQNGPTIYSTDPDGRYKQEIICGSGTTFYFEADSSFLGNIDNVEIKATNNPVFRIIRKPVPENADSVGKPFPIVYGSVEKMLSIWAVSSKSTRQNSFSAGDDVYIIAGHKIKDKLPTDVKVYFGLDENAQGMNYKPGTIDYVPNPLPSSIAEIDHWNENGFSLRDPNDSSKNVAPFHRLIELITNTGSIVTAVQLRGDEYTGWIYTNNGDLQTDGNMPGVNGQPQFPIRYGLGNSKIYVSFRGYEDMNGIITGIPGSLIEHPVDIMKHFLLNYTNIKNDYSKIDEQSFADAKAKLIDWKFSVAITEITDGDKIMDRLATQAKTIWREENGVIKLETLNLTNNKPTVFLDQKKHFTGKQNWSRKKISEIYNDFIFKYGFNYVKNDFDKVFRKNKSNDQYCRDIYSQYGFIHSFNEIECPDIVDSYTIEQLADHYVQLYAVQRKNFSTGLFYRDETAHIEPGLIAEIRFYESDDSTYTENYLITNVDLQKNSIAISALELP